VAVEVAEKARAANPDIAAMVHGHSPQIGASQTRGIAGIVPKSGELLTHPIKAIEGIVVDGPEIFLPIFRQRPDDR
jgi:hypothetical protein